MIKSVNPATLEINGEVEETSIEKIPEIFKKARTIQNQWRKIPLMERATKVSEVISHIVDEFDEISLLISKEVGKPPSEAATNEVYVAIDSTFNYYSTIEDIIGKEESIPLGFYESLDKESIIVHKPIGVILVIGPYNYPFSIPFEQIVQGIMAGNAVVFKPSSQTPLVGKKIQDIFDKTELPKGLVQTVFGVGSSIGNSLIDHSDKVIFTGSTETGKKIMKRAAENLIPVSLELGGKSAMIVLPDANIDRAVRAAQWGCFSNSGQVCASVKRLYLHEDIYDEFLKKLVDVTKLMRQGIPTDPNIDIGAMINEEQLNKVDEMVQIGIKEGAKILIGGRRNPNLKGYFYEPTIFANATNKMQIVQKEIFGPVLVVLKFKTDEEVIEMVNDNPYGLTSSVWTENIEHGRKIAEEINTGTMMINEVVYTFALASTPWGGNKQSGIGRSHGKYGFLEATRPLHINTDKSIYPDMWWMPYDEITENMVENFKIIAKSLVVKRKSTKD